MTVKTHNQELREDISEMLVEKSIEIDNVKVPVLGNHVSRILLECRDSKVSAIKPEFKIVK